MIAQYATSTLQLVVSCCFCKLPLLFTCLHQRSYQPRDITHALFIILPERDRDSAEDLYMYIYFRTCYKDALAASCDTSET